MTAFLLPALRHALTRLTLWAGASSLLWLGACANHTLSPQDRQLAWRYPHSVDGGMTESVAEQAGQPRNLGARFMAATSHGLATEAAYHMLQAGGTAVDAAIAAQMVLTLVEPQSSGIGGGGFLLHYDGNKVQAYDGRETAPALATEKLFQTADGQPMPFYEGLVGGRSVGVPGLLRMLQAAHQAHGKLPWSKLFQPAIQLAQSGYPISPILHAYLQKDPYLRLDPEAAALFYDFEGHPKVAGAYIRNPALAKVFSAVASKGAEAFYTGSIAKDIVSKVQQHTRNPGSLSLQDMAGYEAILREPICVDYRRWEVCGMPPPSSGGIAVAQILGVLEAKLTSDQMAQLKPHLGSTGKLEPTELGIHWLAEAGRLAYADRAAYVADADFVPLPGGTPAALLDKRYLAERAALLGNQSIQQAQPGSWRDHQLQAQFGHSFEQPATAHMSIVDASGHAVAMTTSIEDAFGARLMVDGFLLNNELTDFSFADQNNGSLIANRVQAGKRPRSAMSPTLVFDKSSHTLLLSLGSPGGPLIINYVAKTLLGVLDWGLTLQQAIDLPNFGSRNGATEVERDQLPPAVLDALRARGHRIQEIDWHSGLQGVIKVDLNGKDFWQGAADPRREGAVRGR